MIQLLAFLSKLSNFIVNLILIILLFLLIIFTNQAIAIQFLCRISISILFLEYGTPYAKLIT